MVSLCYTVRSYLVRNIKSAQKNSDDDDVAVDTKESCNKNGWMELLQQYVDRAAAALYFVQYHTAVDANISSYYMMSHDGSFRTLVDTPSVCTRRTEKQ